MPRNIVTPSAAITAIDRNEIFCFQILRNASLICVLFMRFSMQTAKNRLPSPYAASVSFKFLTFLKTIT